MRALALLVLLFLVPLSRAAAVAGEPGDAAGAHTFTMLVYNVHGLFPLAAKDDPRNRTPTIGWLASRYPVGFLMTRLRLPGGAEIDFYNTHLEAGPTPGSASVRSSQFDELAGGIERLSPGRAVIAAGDFNVAFIRPGDRDMMMDFREHVHLDDTGAAPESPFWRERGFVLYRSGEKTRLTVEASGEAREFVNGSRALSDHAALWARVRAEAVAP
jgi:endonuclease/exonuclease/phosphatase family metal-dependent hydrolase